MFKGLPCIVSKIEALEEIIEHEKTGLVVNPDSLEELVKAMIEIYEFPELRHRLGSNAKAKAERTFNIKRNIKEWENFYEEIISKNKSQQKI
ncbi:MAG: hypothetical protein KatS3mg006_0152 [Pyrinomonadaceae bacterium]|jgi:glycosyltransferase involved in cell wall biosynthesis|nr:MAG: hypothetical protein KatS3mg006_0152 [Pyrinomonadaceae bacterium]